MLMLTHTHTHTLIISKHIRRFYAKVVFSAKYPVYCDANAVIAAQVTEKLRQVFHVTRLNKLPGVHSKHL